MRVSVVDRLEICDRQPTSDGYLAVRANIARSGVYKYTRREIGMTDGNPNELVGVYRPEETVFSSDSLASFAHRPVTIGHPSEPVTSKNWKRLAVGQIGDTVHRDGDHVRVDMLLMDQAGINAAKSDAKELSAGYSCDVRPEEGFAPDGEPYKAVMHGPIKANHVALVPKGRAGSTCRIGDAAWPVEDASSDPDTDEAINWLKKAILLHQKHMNGSAPTTGAAGKKSQMLMMQQMEKALSALDGSMPMKMGDSVKEPRNMATFMMDGLKVDLSDEEATETALKKALDARDTAVTAKEAAEAKAATDATTAATALADANAKVSTLEAEKVTLATELADARDPAKLRDAATEYAAVVVKAKALGATVADADSVATVKRAAVNARLGDTAKDWTDAQVDVSFATLSASVKDAAPDAFRDAMANRQPNDFADAAQRAANARQAMIDGFKRQPASAK